MIDSLHAQVRIEQVLMSSPSLLLCFRLSHLLAFYNLTIMNLLDEEAQLVHTLKGCREMASRIFYDQLKAKGDQLQRYPPAPPKDLSPPQEVCRTLWDELHRTRATLSTGHLTRLFQVNQAIRQLIDIVETLETDVEHPSKEEACSELDRVLSAGNGTPVFLAAGLFSRSMSRRCRSRASFGDVRQVG